MLLFCSRVKSHTTLVNLIKERADVCINNPMQLFPRAVDFHQAWVHISFLKEVHDMLPDEQRIRAAVPKPSDIFKRQVYATFQDDPVAMALLPFRVKTNAVAHVPYVHMGPRKKGRPRKYGERTPLASLLKKRENVQVANSPLMGEHHVRIEYIVSDLLWKPIRYLAS